MPLLGFILGAVEPGSGKKQTNKKDNFYSLSRFLPWKAGWRVRFRIATKKAICRTLVTVSAEGAAI